MTLAHQSNALAERWDKSRGVTNLSELFKTSDVEKLDANQIGEQHARQSWHTHARLVTEHAKQSPS